MEGKNRESAPGSQSKKTRAKVPAIRGADRVPLTQDGASTEDSSVDAAERGNSSTAKTGKKVRRAKHRDYTKVTETQTGLVQPPSRIAPSTALEEVELPAIGQSAAFQREQPATGPLVVQPASRPAHETTSLIALSTYHAFHGKRSALEVGLKTTATLTVPLMAVALYKKGGENYVTVVLKKPLEGIYYIFPIFGGYINYMLGTMFVSSTAKSIKNGDELYVTGNDSRSAIIKMYAPLIACTGAGVAIAFPYAAAAWKAASSYVVLVAGSTWLFNTVQFTFAVEEIFSNFVSRIIRATTKDEAKRLAYKLRDRLDGLYTTALRHASKQGDLIDPCLLPSAPRTEHFAEDNIRAIVDYATRELLFQHITHAEVTRPKPFYPIRVPVTTLAILSFMGITWGALGFFVSTEMSIYQLLGDAAAYLVSSPINLVLGLLLGNWTSETVSAIFTLFFTVLCLRCNDDVPALESDWASEHFPKTTTAVATAAALSAVPTFATGVWLNYIIPVGYPLMGFIPLPGWVIGGAQVCAYIFIPVANAYGAIKMARALEKLFLSVWPGVPRDMRDKITVYNGLIEAKDNIKLIPLDKLLLEFGKLPQDLQDTISININGLREAVAAVNNVAAERGSLLARAPHGAGRSSSGFFASSQAPQPPRGQFLDLEAGQVQHLDQAKPEGAGCIMQ